MRVIGKRMCRLGSALRYSHVFSKVVTAPPDDVFGMVIAFANDSHTQKVNLGLGAYKNWELQPVVLDVVRKVEQQIAADQTLNMVVLLPLRSTSPSMGYQGSLKAART